VKAEIAVFWGFIARSIDRILACLDGLSPDELNWRPIESANSLYVLANHIIGTTEENLLGVLCGRSVRRQREAEFAVKGESAESVCSKWRELQELVRQNLGLLSAEELDRKREHPRRGQVTGREVLIIVARHAAEHMGQALLTRDLLLVAQGKELPQRKY